MTLAPAFDECVCFKIGSNRFDYEVAEQDFDDEQLALIKEAEDEWNLEEDE